MSEMNWNEFIEKEAEKFPINEGHEHRFEKKLEHTRLNRQTRGIQKLWWAAAVIVMLLTSVWVFSPSERELVETGVELPAEIGKVQVYFSKQVKELNLNLSLGNDEVINHFVKELSRLEEEYQTLNELYSNQPNNTNLIDGMIENFEFRLRIMQQIKSYLEITQSQKDHENKIV